MVSQRTDFFYRRAIRNSGIFKAKFLCRCSVDDIDGVDAFLVDDAGVLLVF